MVEDKGKRAYGEIGFFRNIIDHFVTHRILMEELCIKGKGLYCYSVAFKKVFYTMYHEHLWRCIEELQVTMNIHLHSFLNLILVHNVVYV